MPPTPLSPMSHAQVREVLSSGAASRFFEEWAEVARLRSEREERLDDLHAQSAVAAARVRLANESAQPARARAEEERRRGVPPGLEPSLRPFIQLESAALAALHGVRATAASLEASEREKRAEALADEANRIAADLQELERQRELLRQSAGELSGYVGESCLFFADATEPGGAWVVPLESLPLGERELTAFVLHRLPPGAPLSEALPVRDVASTAGDAHAGARKHAEEGLVATKRDTLEPPSESIVAAPSTAPDAYSADTKDRG